MSSTPAKLAFLCCAATVGTAFAQTPQKTVVLGAQYEASGFHRTFFGDDYRTLWTTPVSLEVLDLGREAGGLTPVRRVGGAQTMGLGLRSPDGRNWTFRASDKDPSSILPPDLQGGIALSIGKDQIAAGLPAGEVVADTLMDAAGVIHPSVRMVVMPDDPVLGEFQKTFAGLPGTISEFPSVPGDGRPGFAGAVEIVNHEKFAELLRKGDARPDARALLNARLLDVFMGDWDRHRKQWRWARMPDRPLWQPVPEDRDQAFSRFEGLILDLGRNAVPRFVKFGEKYPRIKGQTFNGWEQDRELLAELDAATWDEIAKTLQSKLTDAVIDAAVARMPPEYQKLEAARLSHALKVRRDHLLEEARVYYRHVARRADVYASDRNEQVQVDHAADGSVELRITAGADAYFTRRFQPKDTEEVRIHLQGGDDSVVTHGKPGPITIRVIGGDGNDTLDDSASGKTRFSDTAGKVVEGPGTHVDRNEYVPPPVNPKAPWIPPRDWGRDVLSRPWIGYGPDIGFFLGGTVTFQSYGFRKDPFASRQIVKAGWAFGAQTGKFDYLGDFRAENSGRQFHLHAFASGIETLHFYGFGNETPEQGDDEFYRVDQQQYLLAPSFSWPVGRRVRFDVGPLMKYSTTKTPTDRFIGTIQPIPYGAEDFGEVGVGAAFRLDTRDRVNAASRGGAIEVAGNVYPAVWGVNDTFGEVHATAATFLSAGGYLQPTLALRAGGKSVFGTYPFQEAAYVGGSLATSERTTIRGFRSGRFAGDSSLFGNAELRLSLASFTLLLPADFGVFGLFDVGRVYLEGESSDKWHTGYGGGIWLAFLSRAYTFSAAVATSEQRTAVYVHAGFGF
jgi:hypothetical protein